jgi:hypothetical protein
VTERRTRFVEFETDQPGPPLSWFVDATDEEADEIRDLLEDKLESWQEPHVGPVEPVSFEAFMEDFKTNWLPEDIALIDHDTHRDEYE